MVTIENTLDSIAHVDMPVNKLSKSEKSELIGYIIDYAKAMYENGASFRLISDETRDCYNKLMDYINQL